MSTGRNGTRGAGLAVVVACTGAVDAVATGAAFADGGVATGVFAIGLLAVSVAFAVYAVVVAVFVVVAFCAAALGAAVLSAAVLGAGTFAVAVFAFTAAAFTGVVLTGDLALGAALAVVFGGDFMAVFGAFAVALILVFASVLITWFFLVAVLAILGVFVEALAFVARVFAALAFTTVRLAPALTAAVLAAAVLRAPAGLRADVADAFVVALPRPVAFAAAVVRPVATDFGARAAALDLACEAEAFIGVRADRDLAAWPAVADFRDVALLADAFAVRLLAAFDPPAATDLMDSVRAVLALVAFGLDGMGVHTPWLARVGDGPTTHEPVTKHAFERMQGEAPDRTTANRGASDESDRVEGAMAQRHPAKYLAAST